MAVSKIDRRRTRGPVVTAAPLCCLLCCIRLAFAPALGDPIPTPSYSDAIPLAGQSATATSNEQWEMFRGERTVRNVTSPTLTPVMPDSTKTTGAAVIVAPGGGFMSLSIDNEGFLVAHWLAEHGVAAFVLKYRTIPTPRQTAGFLKAVTDRMKGANKREISIAETPPEALADAEAAVRMVRARAQYFHVDPTRVGFVGFSAGAMITLSVGLAQDKAARPDFLAAIYGPMGALPVPAGAPPLFLAVALDDPLMARGKSLKLIDAWRTANKVEAHLYSRGGHGFGMARGLGASALWIDEFYAWMTDSRLLRQQ
jgi:dienelactone hydrolase